MPIKPEPHPSIRIHPLITDKDFRLIMTNTDKRCYQTDATKYIISLLCDAARPIKMSTYCVNAS